MDDGHGELRKRAPRDFTFGEVLGEGSFSTVLHASEPSTGREFAVKILDKQHIIREKKVKYVTVEKDILNATDHQFIIKLFYTFQDTASLYFVLEYAPNGDLLALLRLSGRFDVETTRFYTGQLVLAVEYLHKHCILHRDVKPENVLLDANYHIKLTDFGSAKLCTQEEFLELSNVDDSLVATPDVTPITSEACAESPLQPPSSESTTKQHKRKASFVGTAEYCSPELLNDRACSPKSDIWALGVVTFQLLSGRHPFRGGSEYQTFQKVLHLEYVFTSDMSPEAKALLQEILVLQPRDRISIDGIKEHAFYAGLDWEGLKTAVAPPKRTWSRSRGSTHTNITILHGSDVTLSDMDAEDEEEVAVADSPLVESNLDQLSLSDKPVPSPVTISSTTKTVPPVASIPSILLELAVQGETCLRSGILRRRSHFLTKTRGLVVTPTRLIFLDLTREKVHSELLLSDLRGVQLKDSHKFYLQFAKGIIHLDDSSGSARDWVDTIDRLVVRVSV